MDLMALAEAERRDLAGLLRTLTSEQWDAPSLCAGWRVHDLVAHLLSYDQLSPPRLAALLVRGRLRISRINGLALRELAARPSDELLATLEACLRPRGLTTGFGGRIGLADALIHQQDIRRPLGLLRAVPAERIGPVLDFVVKDPALPAWRLGRGLRLVATDLDWSHGRGPLVQAPAEALLMAVTGRRAALAECSGTGVGTLTSRSRTMSRA